MGTIGYLTLTVLGIAFFAWLNSRLHKKFKTDEDVLKHINED